MEEPSNKPSLHNYQKDGKKTVSTDGHDAGEICRLWINLLK